MVRFDIVDFNKISGKISNEEVVTLKNFTGMVIWTKQSARCSQAQLVIALDVDDDNLIEVIDQKYVMPAFLLQPMLQMGGASMAKYVVKPIVAVKDEKPTTYIKQEKDTVAVGAKKAAIDKKPEEPKKPTSNACKPVDIKKLPAASKKKIQRSQLKLPQCSCWMTMTLRPCQIWTPWLLVLQPRPRMQSKRKRRAPRTSLLTLPLIATKKTLLLAVIILRMRLQSSRL
jgi:hypothetical protein